MFRLALYVAITAIVIGALSSKLFYEKTYSHELELSKANIEQLHLTVSSTASIATYLEDTELAHEVINGLMTNEIILGVSIHSDEFKETTANFVLNDSSSIFALFSPFEKYKQVGVLTITPNLEKIKERAQKIGLDNAEALMVQGSIGTLIIIIIAYRVVTQPILYIAKSLHTIKPGTDSRVPTPKRHSESELGRLVFDINQLLCNAERQITEERSLRSEVERLSKNFRLLFENSTSPTILIDAEGLIIMNNKAFIELLESVDIPLKKSFGPFMKELFEEKDIVQMTAQFAFQHNEIASGEFKLDNLSSDKNIWMQVVINSTVTDDDEEVYQVILHDITKRKAQLESLNFTANTDQLTQLHNRRGGERAMGNLLSSNIPFALILLDLNKFKPINDIYGHDAGDKVLKHVAEQLKLSVRESDVLSRWGGDEFIVALPSTNKEHALKVAHKIIDNIESPLFLTEIDKKLGKELAVGASLGIAFFPDDDVSLRLLIEHADKAMYEAKLDKHEPRRIKFFQDINNPLI